MPRKARKNSRLELRFRAIKRPRSMTPKQYLRALLRAMDTGELPRGLDVELYWRNPETVNGRSRNWQSGEFTEVIEDSSAGFGSIVRRMLQRKLLR